jgi:hypothetical protein
MDPTPELSRPAVDAPSDAATSWARCVVERLSVVC